MFRAKYKTGSQCVLNSPFDYDYLMVYDTREESRVALETNRKQDFDYHFDSLERIPALFVGCYIYHFMELVEGEEIAEIKNYNFLDHKAEYTELFKKLSAISQAHKWWYHFYLAYVFFSKGEMTLTEQEKETAQNIHDNGISQEMFTTLVEYFK